MPSPMNKWFPHRYRVGVLGMFACALVYTLRVNINVTIVAMTNSSDRVIQHPSDWCPEYSDSGGYDGNGYQTTKVYDWSEPIQGTILGAYFYGFTATQIIGGLLTERFGAKWVCGTGIAIPALINALSPVAADGHYGYLMATRIVVGSFHGFVYSSLFSMYAKWFAAHERTVAIACMWFGSNMGGVFMSPIAGYLSRHGFAGGWPSVFYVSSIIHSVWLVFWWLCAHDSPANDRRISPDEHLYILQNTDCMIEKTSTPVPWRSILSSRTVYASIIVRACGMFGYYTIFTSVPSYFDAIFNVKYVENGTYMAIMYVAIGCALLAAGPLSTLLLTKTSISRTRVRKIFQLISQIGPGICLALVPSMDCNLIAVVVLIVVSMLLYGFRTGGEYPIIPEYAPEFTGVVFGLTNTLGAAMGFLAPIIVGQVLNMDSNVVTREKWNIVFYIMAGLYLLGAVLFELLATADRQDWSYVKQVVGSNIELNELSGNSRSTIKFQTRYRIFSRYKSNQIPENTETPDWIVFKKNTLVY